MTEETKKPANIDEYKKWLEDTFKIPPDRFNQLEAHYHSVSKSVKHDFENSEFWLFVKNNLMEYNDEYFMNTGYGLFYSNPEPQLLIKPFSSFLLKTFRKNILENVNWPNEPKSGWILPGNWYENIKDIVRTLLVVKYFDGVEFLLNKIDNICKDQSIGIEKTLEAKEEGYYAAHLNIVQTFEIPLVTWDTEKVNISIEIQITTQLQEIIRGLLHTYYEDKRQRAAKKTIKWQWDIKSEEFAVNYLGHILHYVEGMILEIRDKQNKE